VNSVVPAITELYKQWGANPKNVLGVSTLDVVRAGKFVAETVGKLELADSINVPVRTPCMLDTHRRTHAKLHAHERKRIHAHAHMHAHTIQAISHGSSLKIKLDTNLLFATRHKRFTKVF
jgi:malate/lactate dehydrogenase